MKFWIDVQLSPALAPWLNATFGVQAFSLEWLGLQQASDKRIFSAAREANAVVITKDHALAGRVCQIHYNPTKHNYVQKPKDWTCSSLHWYEKHFGIEWLRDLWRTHPVRDYGKGWDWQGSGS